LQCKDDLRTQRKRECDGEISGKTDEKFGNVNDGLTITVAGSQMAAPRTDHHVHRKPTNKDMSSPTMHTATVTYVWGMHATFKQASGNRQNCKRSQPTQRTWVTNGSCFTRTRDFAFRNTAQVPQNEIATNTPSQPTPALYTAMRTFGEYSCHFMHHGNDLSSESESLESLDPLEEMDGLDSRGGLPLVARDRMENNSDE
jgi:hypothetical protein